MRRGCLLISGLLVFTLSTGFLFADEKTLKLEAVVVESFDGPGVSTFADGSAVNWQVQGSKFSTEGYPRMTYVPNTWPDDLFGPNPENAEELQVLGINTKYDRMGYNQVEIVPGVGEGDDWVAKPLDLPGRVRMVDLWVWGSNYNYSIEAHFIDYEGLSFRLDLIQSDNKRVPGSIKFVGWKNMYLDIPSYIRQSVVYKPEYRGLRLTKFVIHTHPSENVNDFYVYLDNLKIITDKHETFYDGFGLTSPDRIAEIWGSEEAGE
ncbi:MAG: flagellar filament outer layer protein FlaA [Spirochaetales bacterium]|nr:flagellar filament outer layer protein FlaA [Spirochaetales bacterium]